MQAAAGRLLCGYVAMWLCGFAAMQLCSYVAIWLCVYVAMWLSGYVANFPKKTILGILKSLFFVMFPYFLTFFQVILVY